MEERNVNLSLEVKLKIAERLRKENLENVNKMVTTIVPRDTFYTRYGKRLLDILISLVALIVSSPINLIIAVMTILDVGFPIIFRQKRVGKDQHEFEMIKFRNMKNTTDEKGDLLAAELRVTKWGKFVRKTSLDELLNFVSVFKGDMSIIGPRPLLASYTERYNKRHIQRLAVKPGLECPPMNSDTLRTWQDQFENDIWYVQHVSLLTDIKMIIRLFQYVFSHKNSADRGTGRKAFMGYTKDGVAMNLDDVPEECIKWAYHEIYGE